MVHFRIMSKSAEQLAELADFNGLHKYANDLRKAARKNRERDGYAVYETLGKTPAGVRGEGMKFCFLDSNLEDFSEPPALLAFKKKPSEFFLRGSHSILHDEQVKLIPEEQHKVDKKYPGDGLVVEDRKSTR